MANNKIPALDEFIDLEQRRNENRKVHGFKSLDGVTVAVYDTQAGYQTLTIRISEETAQRHKLVEGARMTCHIHPDQGHIALRAGGGKGSSLFRPKGSKSLVYQTTLKGDTLPPQPANKATLTEVDGVVVIAV